MEFISISFWHSFSLPSNFFPLSSIFFLELCIFLVNYKSVRDQFLGQHEQESRVVTNVILGKVCSGNKPQIKVLIRIIMAIMILMSQQGLAVC